MDEEKKNKIEEARRRMKERIGDPKLGGAGTQRRKQNPHSRKGGMNDSKLDAVMKKFKTQPIPDIAEVHLFTTDNKVISFDNPTDLSSCFSELLQHLGVKQLAHLKSAGLGEAEKKEVKTDVEEPKAETAPPTEEATA